MLKEGAPERLCGGGEVGVEQEPMRLKLIAAFKLAWRISKIFSPWSKNSMRSRDCPLVSLPELVALQGCRRSDGPKERFNASINLSEIPPTPQV